MTTSSSQWTDFPVAGSTLGLDLGPFPFRDFLSTAWDHRTSGTDGELAVAVDGDNAVALSISGDHASFAGQENLTDYHAPIGPEGAELLVQTIRSSGTTKYRLDSMPRAVAEAVSSALGRPGDFEAHEVAAVLSLPESVDDWLASIGKKERHEVRRKRRKFEAEFGPITIERLDADDVELFCAMHRGSSGDKGAFMTDEMATYFAHLVSRAGASIHGLVCDGETLASAFGFETDTGYFYYNSAYASKAAAASPGVVLLSSLIESQIARGATVFDFLKGDERYKFRHGASQRDLYVIEGTLS